MTAFLARFALDAQDAFFTAVGRVPEQFRDTAPAGMNSAAWTITHVAESHQVFVGQYSGGMPREAVFDPFRADATAAMSFGDATEALRRVMAEATVVLEELDEAALSRTASAREGSRFTGWTVQEILARAVAHLYAHAAELGILAAVGGAGDIGLPGMMPNVHGTR